MALGGLSITFRSIHSARLDFLSLDCSSCNNNNNDGINNTNLADHDNDGLERQFQVNLL